MEHSICKSCGNTLTENQKQCPYCGTYNPNFKQTIKKPLFTSDYASNERSSSSAPAKKDNELNICLLIILIIVFWPAAIIYALVKLSK